MEHSCFYVIRLYRGNNQAETDNRGSACPCPVHSCRRSMGIFLHERQVLGAEQLAQFVQSVQNVTELRQVHFRGKPLHFCTFLTDREIP